VLSERLAAGGVDECLADFLLVCIQFVFRDTEKINLEALLIAAVDSKSVISLTRTNVMNVFGKESSAVGRFGCGERISMETINIG
jgi:hypothetical protein